MFHPLAHPIQNGRGHFEQGGVVMLTFIQPHMDNAMLNFNYIL
jgi:hypothetical protein